MSEILNELPAMQAINGRPRKNRANEIIYLATLGFSRKQICTMTGLKRSALRVHLSILRKQNTVNETVNKTVQCESCGSTEYHFDPEAGEVVCKGCGLVLATRDSLDMRLGFDTTYAFTSQLAADKSAGSNLSNNAYCRVLSRSSGGKDDLGIRARQTRIMAEMVEPPPLVVALKDAYQVSKRFRMEGDKLFNNDLGVNIRRAFWLVRALGLKVSKRHMVETVFWYTLCQYQKDHEVVGIESQIRINQSFLSVVAKLNYFIVSMANEEPDLFRASSFRGFRPRFLKNNL